VSGWERASIGRRTHHVTRITTRGSTSRGRPLAWMGARTLVRRSRSVRIVGTANPVVTTPPLCREPTAWSGGGGAIVTADSHSRHRSSDTVETVDQSNGRSHDRRPASRIMWIQRPCTDDADEELWHASSLTRGLYVTVVIGSRSNLTSLLVVASASHVLSLTW
jgi:hypothetical protein